MTCGTPVVLKLTLGALTLDLLNPANGFAVAVVDLGYPATRDDTTPIPDRDGEWDDTAWFGARAVTISGSVVGGGALGSRSKVLDALAPFMAASARSTLTYQIDADMAPRTLTVRATALSAPASNPAVTAFQVGFRCPDPVAYGAAVNTATLVPVLGVYGRVYATPQTVAPTATSGWTPNRVYPALSGATATTATNHGTLNTQPHIVITGPCTNPAVYNDTVAAAFAVGSSAAALVLQAGETVTVDGTTRTVWFGSDPTNSRYDYVDFARSSWWPLVPGPNQLRFVPETAQTASSAVVTWPDAFL